MVWTADNPFESDDMAQQPAPAEGVYERVVGSGKWYARYYLNNKQVRKSFGRDREAAVAWVEGARTVKRSGKGFLPASAKQAIKTADELAADQAAAVLAASHNGVLFGELCDGLLKDIMANPDAEKRTAQPRFARIKRELGDRVAADLKPRELRDWLNDLRKESIYPKRPSGEEAQKVSPATFNRFRTQLSAIYSWGIREEMVSTNPIREVKGKPIGKQNIRWMDELEKAQLLAVLQKWVDACGPGHERRKKRMQHHIYEFEVGQKTGMRLSEQYTVTSDQVNLNRATIELTKAKNGDDRIVHLNEDVVAALRWLVANPMKRKSRSAAQPNHSPPNSVFSLGSPHGWFKKALKEAGIKPARWHDASRHTFCSNLAQDGVQTKAIMDAAGHKSVQSAIKYEHLHDAVVVSAVAGLTKAHASARALSQLSSQPA